MRWGAPALVGAVLVGGCGTPDRPTRSADAPDKAEIYGDAVLVPTRAGEAARDELAAAGEIAAAIRAARWIEDVHVDVEGTRRVVIAGRVAADADEPTLRDDVTAVVDAVLGEDDARALVIAVGRIPDEPMHERPMLPLVLVAIGFGASAGIAIDRALRRRRWRVRTRTRSRGAA